jgi:hypothetical protein
MVHFLVDEQEIRQHNFFPIIRDASRPNTLHDAIAYDGRKVDNADPKPVSFVVSTSNWHVLHLIVLHVLLVENLPLDRIFPSRFLLPETHPLVSRVRESFSLPREAVKRGAYSIDQPLTYQFYSELSDLLRTGIKIPSPPTRNTEPRAIYSTNKVDTDSGLSGTILSSSIGSSFGSSYMASNRSHPDSPLELNVDAEDTNEIVTNHMVFPFIAILSNMLYSNKSPTQPRPEIFIRPDNLLLMLMGFEFRSINDGSGWKTRFSKSQSQWVKTGGAPLFTLEVSSLTTSFIRFFLLTQTSVNVDVMANPPFKFWRRKLENCWRSRVLNTPTRNMILNLIVR